MMTGMEVVELLGVFEGILSDMRTRELGGTWDALRTSKVTKFEKSLRLGPERSWFMPKTSSSDTTYETCVLLSLIKFPVFCGMSPS